MDGVQVIAIDIKDGAEAAHLGRYSQVRLDEFANLLSPNGTVIAWYAEGAWRYPENNVSDPGPALEIVIEVTDE